MCKNYRSLHMHLFSFAFACAGVLYAIFEQQSLIIYFILVVASYVVLSIIYPGAQNISGRKKIMLATWTDPSEGVISVKVPVRTEKCEKLISECSPENRVTMTHFALKAVGELLYNGPDINGKLVFGKFVPYKTCDASCLVDIDGGKDLAMILIRDIANKSVEEIAAFIREKGKKIKQGKGDSDHKKRTGIVPLLPAFLVSTMIKVVSFLNSKLGLTFAPLGIKKDQFGAVCVTSVGMLNFDDATAPFSGFMNCVSFLTVNSVQDAPVVEEGKVVAGRVMNCNFVVDHRYIDGGKAKNLIDRKSVV